MDSYKQSSSWINASPHTTRVWWQQVCTFWILLFTCLFLYCWTIHWQVLASFVSAFQLWMRGWDLESGKLKRNRLYFIWFSWFQNLHSHWRLWRFNFWFKGLEWITWRKNNGYKTINLFNWCKLCCLWRHWKCRKGKRNFFITNMESHHLE